MKQPYNEFGDKVIEDINNIRKNPSNYVKRFDVLKTGLSRFKGSKDIIKELDIIIKYLSSAASIEPLKVSSALCQAAQKQIEVYEENKKFEVAYDKDELDNRVKKFATGFSRIFQTSDDGADEPTDVINRLVMSKMDVDRVNRKIVMDNTLNYIGVAHKVIKGENIIVIICADKVVEKKRDDNKPESIINYLNSIRVRPIEHVSTFEITLSALKDKRSNKAKQLSQLVELLNSLTKKPRKALNKSDILLDLGEQFFSNEHISTEEDFAEFAKKSYSEFSFLSFYFDEENLDYDELVQKMLVDPDKRRIFLEDERTKLIGVMHKDDTNLVIACDHIEIGAEMTFENKIVNVVNKFRRDPSAYVDLLTHEKNKIIMKYGQNKKGLVSEIGNLIRDIKEKKYNRLPEIKMSEDLSGAAKELLDHAIENRVKKVYAQDEDYLKILAGHYVSGFSMCKEFVDTGSLRAEHVLMNFLVSFNEPERESRKALLSKDILYAGASFNFLKGTPVTIMLFTDNAEPVVKEPTFKEELLTELNNLRMHPKSYVKFVKQMIDSGEYPPALKSKSQKENYLQDLYLLKSFLEKTRTFAPLILDPNLTRATEVRLNNMIDQGDLKRSSQEDLRAFLSDFGSNYNFVHQFEDYEESARDYLLWQLTDPTNNKANRDIIFSRYLKFVGIAASSELEKKQEAEAPEDEHKPVTEAPKMMTIIFADHFDLAKEILNKPDYSRRGRLSRPQFTDDEIFQIQKDFSLLDVLNTGYIRPEAILVFMNKCRGFTEKNPFYYETLEYLNSEENNVNGVNVEEFTNGLRKVIDSYNEEQRWEGAFNLYCNGKNKILDYDLLRQITLDLEIRLSDEEIEEIVERIDENNTGINKGKFAEVMDLVENYKKNI